MQSRPLLASFKRLLISKVGQGSAETSSLHDILVNLHVHDSHVEVEGQEGRLGSSEILRMIHSVAFLILIPIEITHGPLDLKTSRSSSLVLLELLILFREVHPLNIDLEVCKLLAVVENVDKFVCFLFNFIVFGFL